MNSSFLLLLAATLLLKLERGLAATLPQTNDLDDYIVIFERSSQEERDNHHAWLKREVLGEVSQDSGVQSHIHFDDEFSGYHGQFTTREVDLIAKSEHVKYVEKAERKTSTSGMPDHEEIEFDSRNQQNRSINQALSRRDEPAHDDCFSDPNIGGISSSDSSTGPFSSNKFNEPSLSDTFRPGGEEVTDFNSTWGLAMISHKNGSAENVYAYNTPHNKDVIVYVLDDICRPDHEQYAGRVRFSEEFSEDYGPQLSHGTKVMSIVGGKTLGVARDAELVSVRLRYGDIQILALDWVLKDYQKPENRHKRAVVNFSSFLPKSRASQELIFKAQSLGIPFVLSVANDEMNECNHLSFVDNDLTVMVGSVNENYERHIPSAYGKCVDVFAPGTQIRLAGAKSSDDYYIQDGTSFATAYVSGVIAYLWGQDFDLTALEVVKKATRSNPGRLKEDTLRGSPNHLLYNGKA